MIGIPDQRQVANHVQNLVAHELVLEPQRIEHAGLAEDDRVLERAAEREPALAQHLDFLQEAERPRRRDLVDEHVLVEVDRLLLMPEQRMIEADRVADLEAIGRIEGDALVALLELHRPEDLDRLARRGELLHAGVLNQVDPRRRAAVHDRHFGLVQLDADVVDVEAAERRQQVLDGLDGRRAGREPGLQLRAAAQMRRRGPESPRRDPPGGNGCRSRPVRA